MMLTRRETLALGAVGLFSSIIAPRSASACMPGLWHPRQDAVTFWNDGVQVLVWRTLVSRTPPPGARLATIPAPRAAAPSGPTPLAWLLAVPSAPIAYEACTVADFEGTMGWARALVSEPPGGGIGGFSEGSALAIGPTVRVGEYDITPIAGTGPAAATQLAAWLHANHFPPASAGAIQAYARENATFLAVRAQLPASVERAELHPLAIAFRTPSVVVPVRLSVDEPAFALDVAVFSSRVIAPPPTDAAHGLYARPLRAPGASMGGMLTGQTVIVPSVSFPAVARQLIAPIARRVPQMSALLTNSLAMCVLRAAPVNVVLGRPDPTFVMRAPVAPNAPGGVVTS
ncbi:MAG: DUF2330 domain-containing protein [Deltaproteobacteria bacterium]